MFYTYICFSLHQTPQQSTHPFPSISSIIAGFPWAQPCLPLPSKGCAGFPPGPAAYPVFLRTIPGRFYSICMLCFVLATAVTGRDFGPMLKAERLAGRGIAPPFPFPQG